MNNRFFKWVKHLFINESVTEDDLEEGEELIDEVDGYVLTETPSSNYKNVFVYRVFDPEGILIGKWQSGYDAASMTSSAYKSSTTRTIFSNVINNKKKEIEQEERISRLLDKDEEPDDEDEYDENGYLKFDYDFDDEDDEEEEKRPLRSFGSYGGTASRSGSSGGYRQTSMFDDDEDWWLNGGSTTYYPRSTYRYTPPKKSAGFLDKLNKSDTLVIHCEDRSTDMLSQIYEGKNWDVLRDGNIDKDELHQLLDSHDRIVMLGHGTSGGLINKQGGGVTIGAEEAPHLKDKKLFVIWCNADKFFRNHGIGQGQFLVDNVPSEKWESSGAGCGNISSELMLENITYWSKLCADVVEQALEGDVDSAVKYIRKNYLEQYGNHPVTIYNAYSTDKHDVKTPLPKYEFKGKPLEPKDYPYPGYNEEEFLKNPRSTISGNSPYAS